VTRLATLVSALSGADGAQGGAGTVSKRATKTENGAIKGIFAAGATIAARGKLEHGHTADAASTSKAADYAAIGDRSTPPTSKGRKKKDKKSA
jgi:hypothetical protein